MRVIVLRARGRWKRKLKALGIAISSLFTRVKITSRNARYDNLRVDNRFARAFLSLFYEVRVKRGGMLYVRLKRRHRG